MKKIWIAASAIAMMAAMAIGFGACTSEDTTIGEGAVVVNTNSQGTGVWVSGEGKVYAIPDLGILQVGVEAQAATVAEAHTQAAAAMEALQKALQDAGLEDRDIQTSSFSIYPVREWDPDTGEERLAGFRVSNMVAIKIRNLDKAGSIIDSVVTAGGDYTRIEGISFTVEDPTPYYDQARTKAVADARHRAEQLAAGSGIKLGKLCYMTESVGYVSPVRYAIPAPYAEFKGDTPISAGELEITLNVQVNFEIQQ